jgi:hypothetical protein
MLNWKRCVALGGAFLFLVQQHISIALAQDANANTPPDSSDSKAPADVSGWHFTIAPYAWAFGIEGDVGVAGHDTSVDASFTDILKDSDGLMALQGHAEAQYDRFGLFVDGTYADIQASFEESGAGPLVSADLDVDVDQELVLIELGTFYRLVDRFKLWQSPVDRGGGTFTFDALAGARYTYLGLDVNGKLDINKLAFKRDVDGSHDWVDPFVGGRLEVGLTESVDFALRGDVGGFGVGSDFTWNTQALLGYRFSLFGANAEAWGGYRALGQDYDEGSGRTDFEWDVILHGPIIGMTVRW